MIRHSSKLGKDAWIDFLKERGLRLTPERDMVYRAVAGIDGHFTSEALSEAIRRKKNFHVSRATVYNVLKLLTDARLIVAHQINGCTEYEYTERALKHDHQICLDCGLVQETPTNRAAESVGHLRTPGFHLMYYALYVYGVCASCRRRSYRKKAKEQKEQKR